MLGAESPVSLEDAAVPKDTCVGEQRQDGVSSLLVWFSRPHNTLGLWLGV